MRSSLRLLVLSLVLVGCGRPPTPPPPVPADLYDDVSSSLAHSRQEVIDAPRSAAAWGDLAMLFDAHDLTLEAEACYRQAMALDGEDGRWPYLLGTLLVTADPSEAETLFRQASHHSNRAEPGIRLAALLRDRGRAAEAVEVLRVEAAADPQMARIHYELARCLEQATNTSEAVEEAATAARLASRHRSVREYAAELLSRVGRLDEAREEAAAAMRLPRESAGWPDPWREAVRSLRRDPHWQASSLALAATSGQLPAGEALTTLAGLATAHPDDWTIAGEFAQLLLVAGELDAARQAATKALERHPEAVGLWKIRGTAALLGEDWQSAESDLSQALILKPDDAAACNDLAFVQAQLGRDAAVATLETAIRLEPLDIEKRTRLIELLLERGLPTAAERAVDELAAVAGDHPAVAQLRAAVTEATAEASSAHPPPSSETSE